MPSPAELLPAIQAAALHAGGLAMEAFRPGARTSAGVQSKAGGSPVTDADHAVDRYLGAELAALDRDAGWLSEETADTPERLGKSRLFIVDPIDGTRAFMSGDPRWGVSIALVENGRPILGLLHLPALERTYSAILGEGARLNGDHIRVSDAKVLRGGRIAGPAPMIERFARGGPEMIAQAKIPSLAFRLALIASGEIEVALASTAAHDWDIAAADLIVHEAGGFLADRDGRPPVYNKPSTRHDYLAAAPERLRDETASRLRAAF